MSFFWKMFCQKLKPAFARNPDRQRLSPGEGRFPVNFPHKEKTAKNRLDTSI